MNEIREDIVSRLQEGPVDARELFKDLSAVYANRPLREEIRDMLLDQVMEVDWNFKAYLK